MVSSKPALNLYTNLALGTDHVMFLGDGHTGFLCEWRRSIRANGGYWLGEGTMTPGKSKVTMDTCLEMFIDGMARRIVENVGGIVTWEGFIAEMDLTIDGVTYRRSLLDRANAVRAIYAKIGDNLLTNGSAESSVWDSVGTPTTIERVTTWQTRGTYGMHIIADDGEGARIGSGISISAGIAYQAQVTVEVESGTWEFEIRRSDNDEQLIVYTISDTGRTVPQLCIGDDNEYTGNVYVQLVSDSAGAECYADGAVLQIAPYRTETEWITDTDSIAEWGRIENVLLEAGMTDGAATALINTELDERAWPRSVPPDEFLVGETQQDDGLWILFAGYVMTLNWRYVVAGGTDTASNHVDTIVGESEFVTTGTVETNSLSTQIEEVDPVLAWDALEEIIRDGDSDGDRWTGGVYGSRQFNYEEASSTVDYHYRNGRLLAAHGGAIEPWFALPGVVRLDDAPVGPAEITGDERDDPRNVFAEEITYIAPDGLKWRREVI